MGQDGHVGRGECVPYPRYGESPESVCALISEQADAIASGATRTDLLTRMGAGAARNALDCALLDLEAKQIGRPAWEIAGLSAPQVATTAYTLSLGTPESMEEAARGAAHRPLLKVKLGGEGDPERIAAVRRGAPNSRLIVDANEAWRAKHDRGEPRRLRRCGRRPDRANRFRQGRTTFSPRSRGRFRFAPTKACTTVPASMLSSNRYDAINIKLDKAGGLTEAVMLAHEARARGISLMIGCMVGTSLAMAPAMLLAHHADYVDLDGPLLLARDRDPALRFDGSLIHPPTPDLWG